MRPLWLYFEISAVAFVACLVLIALSNWRVLRRIDRYSPPAHMPRVSVLVPARNEEAHIGDCVRSLLAQDYPDFEVVVLNDHSTDRTGRDPRCFERRGCTTASVGGRGPAGRLAGQTLGLSTTGRGI